MSLAGNDARLIAVISHSIAPVVSELNNSLLFEEGEILDATSSMDDNMLYEKLLLKVFL
jgi:hypothetical protein